MVTTPEKVTPPPTKSERTFSTIDAAIRVFLAGSEAGAVRRILLYVIVAVGLWGAADWWVFSVTALVALFLLIATDDLR